MEEVKLTPEQEKTGSENQTVIQILPNGILQVQVQLDSNKVVSYGIVKYLEKMVDNFYMRKEMEAVKQKSFIRNVMDKIKQ